MTDLSRYVRQMRYPPMGEASQTALLHSRALICGCGALGSVTANTLARAGVGKLRIVDRDVLELSNLQRQVIYDEQDVREGLPKAIAAKQRLEAVNSEIEIEAIVADVSHQNIHELCQDVDVILDGTDNFETRFLLNDASIKFNIPWIYGGCIGADGQTMTIVPGKSACLRCLMADGPPPPGTTPTCDSAGILAPIISVIASLQSLEAIKILSGNLDAVSKKLMVFELWDNQIRQMDLSGLLDSQTCRTCQDHQFDWLDGQQSSQSVVLCGRNSVQLRFPNNEPIILSEMAERLKNDGELSQNKFLLRFKRDELELTLFPDGRAIVSGTEDFAVAKSFYARWVGN